MEIAHAHPDPDRKKNIERGARLQRAVTLRDWRKLTALAAALGVNESALTRWRQGGALSLDSAAKLAVTLDVSLDWLVLGRGSAEHHRQPLPTDGEGALLGTLRAFPPETAEKLGEFLATLLPPR